MLAVLRNRTYRTLFASQVLSLIGTGLTTVALALLAYDLAGADAGAVLGTALALKMIAYVTIAPIAGAFANRLPRRSFLIALDLARAGLVALLPFVTGIWQIYVLIFAFQALSAAFTPTFQATIPDILTDEAQYTRALSLSRLAFDMEALVSPALAAVLLSIMSYSNLFLGNVVGFLASAALILTVSLPRAKAASTSNGVLKRIGWGMRIYLWTPRLRGLLAINMVAAAAGAFVIVNTVVLVRQGFGGGERDVAILMAAYGVASMIVALVLPKWLDRHPAERPLMLFAAAFLMLGLVFTLLPGSLMSALPVWALLGAANALALTPTGRLLRRSSLEADRPALFAAQFSLSHACWLLTYPLAGWLGATLGLPATALLLTTLAALSILAAFVIWPAHDPRAIRHSHAGIVHAHGGAHDQDHAPQQDGAPHRHEPVSHIHPFVIDAHHRHWPNPA